MLLVAYLRQLHARGQHFVDGYSDSILFPMINVSDNGAASAVYGHVGDGGLYALAHRAGMTDFNVYGSWANAQLSPADQARYFFEMDSLIPREFVGYARRLLSTIVGYESWGIPAVARPHRLRGVLQGRLARHGARPARAPGGPPGAPGSFLRDGRHDRRRSLDGLRDRHHPGSHQRARHHALTRSGGVPGAGAHGDRSTRRVLAARRGRVRLRARTRAGRSLSTARCDWRSRSMAAPGTRARSCARSTTTAPWPSSSSSGMLRSTRPWDRSRGSSRRPGRGAVRRGRRARPGHRRAPATPPRPAAGPLPLPYEGAAWAIISARRPARRAAAVRRELAEHLGARFELAGHTLHAFPQPEALLEQLEDDLPGLGTEQASRLRGVAQAAAAGQLDVGHLHELGPEPAHAELQQLRGLGPFHAGLVVLRASGFTDAPLLIAEPKVLAHAARLYGLAEPPTLEQFAELAETWRPFRTCGHRSAQAGRRPGGASGLRAGLRWCARRAGSGRCSHARTVRSTAHGV